MQNKENSNLNKVQSLLKQSQQRLSQMNEAELEEYHRQLMDSICSKNKQLLKKKNEQQRLQEKPQSKSQQRPLQKQEQEPERLPQFNQQRISRSILYHPDRANNSQVRQPSQHDRTSPTQIKQQDLRSTRAISAISSQNSYDQSQQLSDYLRDENDRTANTTNFIYRSQNRKSQQENLLPQLLENVCNQSSILSQQEPSLSYSEIQRLSAAFLRQFKFLKVAQNQKTLKRALKSLEYLSSWKQLFVEDKNTGLFKMDFVSKNGIAINQGFFIKLKNMDLFFLYRIEIGPSIKSDKVIELLNFDYDSLREVSIERKWHNKDGFREHGLQVLTSIQNQKRISLIEWKADRLTQKFVQGFKDLRLNSLLELNLKLSEKVEDEQLCGDLLQKIFESVHNSHDPEFRINLYSSVIQFEKLGPSVYNFDQKIHLKQFGSNDSNSSNQIKKQQHTQVENKKLQQQAPKSAFTKKQQPKASQQQIKRAINKPQETQQKSEQDKTTELLRQLQLLQRLQQSQQNSPFSNSRPQQGPVINDYKGIKLNATKNGSISGGVNIGGTQYNFGTSSK